MHEKLVVKNSLHQLEEKKCVVMIRQNFDRMNQGHREHQERPEKPHQVRERDNNHSQNSKYWETVLHPPNSNLQNQCQRSEAQSTASKKNGSRGDTQTGNSVSKAASRPRFTCSHCNKNTFERKGHLESHVKSVHYGKKEHVCQSCEKSFGHRSSLQRHVKNVHENPEHPNYRRTTSEMWFCWCDIHPEK